MRASVSAGDHMDAHQTETFLRIFSLKAARHQPQCWPLRFLLRMAEMKFAGMNDPPISLAIAIAIDSSSG